MSEDANPQPAGNEGVPEGGGSGPADDGLDNLFNGEELDAMLLQASSLATELAEEAGALEDDAEPSRDGLDEPGEAGEAMDGQLAELDGLMQSVGDELADVSSGGGLPKRGDEADAETEADANSSESAADASAASGVDGETGDTDGAAESAGDDEDLASSIPLAETEAASRTEVPNREELEATLEEIESSLADVAGDEDVEEELDGLPKDSADGESEDIDFDIVGGDADSLPEFGDDEEDGDEEAGAEAGEARARGEAEVDGESEAGSESSPQEGSSSKATALHGKLAKVASVLRRFEPLAISGAKSLASLLERVDKPLQRFGPQVRTIAGWAAMATLVVSMTLFLIAAL
jgi:hypothetical protein